MDTGKNKIKLDCKTMTVLKNEYGVSLPTMKKLLKMVPDLQVESRETRSFSPKEVRMIYSHLGAPGEDWEDL